MVLYVLRMRYWFFCYINLFLVSLCRPNKDLIANFPDSIDWIYLIPHSAGRAFAISAEGISHFRFLQFHHAAIFWPLLALPSEQPSGYFLLIKELLKWVSDRYSKRWLSRRLIFWVCHDTFHIISTLLLSIRVMKQSRTFSHFSPLIYILYLCRCNHKMAA